MKYKVFNEDNLKDEEIDETVIRVKAFIMNNINEVLVASSNGGVQLIGGHVEEGEEQVNALKREIMEEAGIDVSNNEISEPFFEVRHYIKNYFNTSKNTVAKIIYYVIKTNKTPDLEHIKLTNQEKDYGFNINFIPINNFEEYVNECLNSEKEVNRLIAKEMLSAFDELKKKIYGENY